MGGKRGVAVWHRRAGKDELCLHFTACMAHTKVGAYWHMLPEAAQARKAIWNMVNPHTGKRRVDEAFPLELRKRTNDQEMFIEFKNGSTWQLCGSDNYNSLVGSSVVGVVMSEYALANPAAWAYFSPILMENDGWALFISTPRGKNHLHKLYELGRKGGKWFAQLLRAQDTKVFSDEQLADELDMKIATHGEDYGRALFEQEYNCSFDAAIPGAIWADAINDLQAMGRIGEVSVETLVPVHTAWDLGRTDDTAIWFFQVVAGEIRIVDCHSSNGKDIAFYADLLRKWGKDNKAQYGTHFLPHDARPRTLASGGKSILQQLQAEDVGRCVIVARLDVQEGIQAARATLKKCWFDEKRCENGLEALKNYHREWDDEKKRYSDAPEHDWSSHYADAFRYLSLAWKNPKVQEPTVSFDEEMNQAIKYKLTYGDIKKRHFAKIAAKRSDMIH